MPQHILKSFVSLLYSSLSVIITIIISSRPLLRNIYTSAPRVAFCGGLYYFYSTFATYPNTNSFLKRKIPYFSKRLSAKFNKLWVCAEIILFVLVGAIVDINYASKAGIRVVILILIILCFRMLGVFVCMIKTRLNIKERLFCMVAYIPKATVQATIGGMPLAMGLECGNLVLSIAVIAILVSAPLGGFLIDFTYKKLLTIGEEK